MEKLKTLKDIEFEGLWNNNFPRMHAWKTRDKLKKEAIKWIKNEKWSNKLAVVVAFQEFFNITEEDLK